MESRGEVQSWEDVLRAQEERDRRDAARDLAPMVPAADARIVDNTHLTLEQVVDLMEAHVRRRLAENTPPAKEELS
jgi:cytidylate kinase